MLDLIKTFLIKGIQLLLFIIVIWLLFFLFSFFKTTFPNIIPKDFIFFTIGDSTSGGKNKNPQDKSNLENQNNSHKIYNLFPDFNFIKPVNKTIVDFIFNN